MGYINPKINALPMQSGAMRFWGKGLQVRAVKKNRWVGKF